jgi:hypothetical protein
MLLCQTFVTLSQQNLEYDGILGIGWGVFIIIIFLILAVFCCIFGLSTLYPGTFVIIGFCTPTVVFLFLAFTPNYQPGNLNLKDNDAKNYYVIARWFFFTIMLTGIIFLFIPLCCLWTNMLIPQRVDSRAQRDYYDKYEKVVEEDKLRQEKEMKKSQIMNLKQEGEEILLPVRNRPMDGRIVNENEINEDNLDAPNDEISENINPRDRKKKFLMGLRRKKDPSNEQ